MTGFEADVRPLFSERDRDQMEPYFDLWRLEDVREFAQPILERLEIGDMPCDGAWPAARVDLFRRWVDEGMNP